MELNRLSWETFTRTGDIDAYLLYKTVSCKPIFVIMDRNTKRGDMIHGRN